jgi:hypothetical protein
MNHPILAAAGLALCLGALSAQTTTVVPAVCTSLPGNAALAMPFRWSQGTLQVFVDAPLLPAALTGQSLTGLRLRRSALLGDVACPALSRTLTVRGGFQPVQAVQMSGTLSQNRPASVAVLFGPQVVNLLPQPAPSPAASLGADLITIPFAVPLPVGTGSLFLEFELSGTPFTVSAEHWVDGVWFGGGIDNGLAVTVGTGACTGRPAPTELRWTGATGPQIGTTASLEVQGAPPTLGTGVGLVVCWVGADPQGANFGLSLAAFDPSLVGCYQWAPTSVAWFGLADAQGRFPTTFPIPAGVPVGSRLGVQAGWFDTSRAVVPLSFSNGLVLVLGSAGVDNRCASMFFPGTATASPWGAFLGQMPVLLLEH